MVTPLITICNTIANYCNTCVNQLQPKFNIRFNHFATPLQLNATPVQPCGNTIATPLQPIANTIATNCNHHYNHVQPKVNNVIHELHNGIHIVWIINISVFTIVNLTIQCAIYPFQRFSNKIQGLYQSVYNGVIRFQ